MRDFPGGSVVKNPPASAKDTCLDPCSILQYSCLENPMDGGTWWAVVHGVTKQKRKFVVLLF